jgi:hypothetical protein
MAPAHGHELRTGVTGRIQPCGNIIRCMSAQEDPRFALQPAVLSVEGDEVVEPRRVPEYPPGIEADVAVTASMREGFRGRL